MKDEPHHTVEVSVSDMDSLKAIKSYFYNSEHGLSILAYKVLKRITDQVAPAETDQVGPASFEETPPG